MSKAISTIDTTFLDLCKAARPVFYDVFTTENIDALIKLNRFAGLSKNISTLSLHSYRSAKELLGTELYSMYVESHKIKYLHERLTKSFLHDKDFRKNIFDIIKSQPGKEKVFQTLYTDSKSKVQLISELRYYIRNTEKMKVARSEVQKVLDLDLSQTIQKHYIEDNLRRHKQIESHKQKFLSVQNSNANHRDKINARRKKDPSIPRFTSNNKDSTIPSSTNLRKTKKQVHFDLP
jgi:hypothetical protein